MDAGRATSTLSKFMTEHGATPQEVTQAQSDLAKGLGTGAPQPVIPDYDWSIFGVRVTNAMIGAGVGSAIGSGAGKVTENVSSEIGGAVVGSITSEVVGGKVTDQLDARKKANENK